ncbi:MAG: hypothetical protein LBR68_03065 [Lachnoclostridium sp.]|jgi:hypothetical protein|nr:hypothetical protein [Lachnoclostridium sp.]
MRKPKIYLETTLFNFYFDTDRDAHAATVKLFEEIAAGKYEPFTSRYVVDELEQDTTEKREKMLNLIKQYEIPVFGFSDEAETLADIYVADGIIPVKYRTDGLHIAISTINDLDMIISMNFQHIVKRKTKLATANINTLNGYRAIEILNPMEVIDDEKE